MINYLIQFNKKQAKAFMPTASIPELSSSLNPISSSIPSISLLPRGGFWFDIIGEKENILRFISYCMKNEFCINYKIKESKAKKEIDFSLFESSEPLELSTLESNAMTREEKEEQAIMNDMRKYQEALKQEQDALPTPSALFNKQ